jgi:hypothetical protein
MIAEVFPAARDLVTRTDLAAVRAELLQRIAEFEVRMVGQMAALESRLMGRLWVMFVPLWLGVFGVLGTLIAMLVQR